MAAYLSPVFGAGAQLFNNQGVVLAGGKINTYLAGSTTPLATWTDSTQIITNANPIILDSAGRPLTEIWFQAGTLYKLVLTDANNNVLGTWDNIAGLNDITSSIVLTEWVATNLIPSFINTTSFSVPGNNTATFPVNCRVKIAVSAGTVYGYVVSSAFTTVTTVVIQSDALALDSGVSSVSVGLLSSVNPSYPQQLLPMNAPVTVASAATTAIGAALSANVIVSGVVTITAFDTVIAGILRFVKFTGILTLTHNGTSLILPGAANITTQAGDQAIFRSLGGGNWECVNYITANWRTLNATNATTATTAVDTASKTGTGSTYVTNTSPTLITPNLGTPSSGNLANLTLQSASPTIGVGYATGAGGTVTQLSSKTTTVTLNKTCGQIITHNAPITAGQGVAFIFVNSTIAATDTVTVSLNDSLAYTYVNYMIMAVGVRAGQCNILIRCFDLAETLALPINFSINKAVAN